MAYEGTHTQASIKERAAKLQEEAAVLQAKIVQHLQHNHGQSIGAAAFDEEDDELTA